MAFIICVWFYIYVCHICLNGHIFDGNSLLVIDYFSNHLVLISVTFQGKIYHLGTEWPVCADVPLNSKSNYTGRISSYSINNTVQVDQDTSFIIRHIWCVFSYLTVR